MNNQNYSFDSMPFSENVDTSNICSYSKPIYNPQPTNIQLNVFSTPYPRNGKMSPLYPDGITPEMIQLSSLDF